jgi:hypothetical protein
MKTNTYLILLVKGVIVLLLLTILSCGNNNNNADRNHSNDSGINYNPDIRDRNNEMDGDDTKQPLQDQDSVNRVINENRDKQVDTLPEGIK